MTSINNYVGKQIGNYFIKKEIASGSFGSVFRAEHSILTERIVAIKVLHTHLVTQERDQFIQEAYFLERLKHGNILPIIDIGFHDDFPYIVVEYAVNGSLRDRIQRKSYKLSLEETLTILPQVGLALEHAHQKNIIHRDLKPENILFNAKGEPLLADFGIAVVLETTKTAPADVIGTPAYMAPEQFDGLISKKSDQYALACIAYELLTGHRPFTAFNNIALALKHKTENVIAPTQLNTNIPIHIEQAILKAMAKNRIDRYPSVLDFIVAMCNPGDKDGWLNAGRAYLKAKRGEEALKSFEQAILLVPNSADGYRGKADALMVLGQYLEAMEYYNRSMELNRINTKLTRKI